MATVGVDLGGTKILVASVHHGKVEDSAKVPTPTGGPESVVEAIAELVEKVGGAKEVGIGAPGQVHHKTGVVVAAPNLVGWGREVPLGPLVAEALGGSVEVRVDNDVNVAVLGEHHHGAAKEADDVLGAWVGTGVGGGLILGGKLGRGRTGMAGELGHMTVVAAGGRRCGCGQFGHIEAYAGRGSLEAEARRRAEEGAQTALVELAGDERMKSSVFAKALDRGDQLTGELIDDAVVALGAGLASAVNLVDVGLIVIGGGLGDKLGPAFVGRVEEAVRSRLWAGSTVRVVPSELGDDAGVVGAAALFD
jgi:glucokinase